MEQKEKETRKQLIDPKLRLAGWDVLTKNHVVEKSKACIETLVSGMPKTSENQSGNGFVDYTMFGDDGKPLAIIEAKKSVVNEEQGRVQACLYADALEKQYGIRPIIYYTNGFTIKIIDGIYPARVVFGFHKKDELEYLIQKRKHNILDNTPNTNICGRYYQMDAIAEIIKNFQKKRSRSLIVLATGTGKTRTACGLSDIFIRNNFVKRILFLADRKNLVTQAKEETFDKYLSTIPMATIIEGKHEGAKDARIIFSTYQSMLSIIKDTTKAPFGIGHFDLIIVDEAHRSLFNKYAEIFNYFDALMLGLTATPRKDIHKSTYKVFDIGTDTPNYEYDVQKAVKDGFLVYYRALDRTPDILKNGVTYDELDDEEKEQYEELFTDDDGTIPKKIEGKKFYSIITNKDTIRAVLRDLMEEGLKVNNGDILGKTIIFARDHNHAIMIQNEFRKMYPELCNTNSTNGVDYCVVIDNKIRYNEVLQREFKNKQDIRIVVSVDMMDTGVDIPEVVNLVFFKKVMSKIKFWQMIGRGTRLCDDLKVLSPSKAYFERMTNDVSRQFYQNKQGFLIFDICNVFNFFKLNPDGRLDKYDEVLSLNQKIFMEKVVLFKAMQSRYAMLTDEDKYMYIDIRDSLINEILMLNRNYIGVQNNLKYVEKYSELSNWKNFNQQKFIEIKKHIAPNIIGESDIESARAFDYLAYKFSATKLIQNNDFHKTAKAIYELAIYLGKNKMHIGEVAAHKKTIEYLQTDKFIIDTTATNMNTIRIEIRDLIRYIEKEILEPIISDFEDKISSFEDAPDEEVDFTTTVDDFKSYEEKVRFYINAHTNKNLIYKIVNLQSYTDEDIESFKQELMKFAKSQGEYESLFSSDKEIVCFIRKNMEITPSAIQEFLDNQKAKGRTDEQLTYIKELLVFINKNGKFERKDLLKEELHFAGLFDNLQIVSLLTDLENVL
ncbi:MAG: DEAD/DEAH box helicase family protein [Clostridium perfringens]|nr:DEAD/DEAH box helicase family protein [Clostridium perfringens]MDU5544022.1 DEAD/DEAH box helicase family protein [Clostridium perfringens]